MNVATDAQVFDALRALFGVGDYDGSIPFYSWRAKEIIKIRVTREKRRVDASELLITARWCRGHEVWIKAHWELYEHLTEALAADRAYQADAAVSDLESAILVAISIEVKNPESPWCDRLIRAAGPARKEVYREWQEWYSHSGRGDGGPASTALTSNSTPGAGSGVK